jgi:hypothetical protein
MSMGLSVLIAHHGRVKEILHDREKYLIAACKDHKETWETKVPQFIAMDR